VQHFEIDLKVVFFPLHPDTPAEGLSLETLFAGRGFSVATMHNQMAELMRIEGLPYGERTHTYNSRLAQELGKWVDRDLGIEAIHDALYRSYFVDGRNLADLDVLVDVAQSVGVTPDVTRNILMERRVRWAVDADWERSRRAGITSVPTFVAAQQRVVGAQPYEALEALVRAAGAQARQGNAAVPPPERNTPN